MTVKIKRKFFRFAAQTINANGAAASRFWCQKTWLIPPQSFLNSAHAISFGCRVQNKVAQINKPRLHLWLVT